MDLRVAVDCSNRLTVQPGPEDLDYFSVGSRFYVALMNRSLFIRKHANGPALCADRQRYLCGDYLRSIEYKLPDLFVPFHLNDAQFEIEGDMLLWKMPAQWELPWTRCAPRTFLDEVVRRNLSMRCASARRNGVDLQRVTTTVPDWARGVLSVDEWRSIVEG